MALTFEQMRAIAHGNESVDMIRLWESGESLEIMSMDEAVTQFALDEAFFGKSPVVKIQSAMDKLYAKVMGSPNVPIQGSTEAKALEKAFCDVFGFSYCSIYWAYRPGMSLGAAGPCTWPRSKILHAESVPFKYGQNQRGFYDSNHELKVYINTDQTLFTMGGLTSAEMVAILLHEVGHNFDYSMWTLLGQWSRLISTIVDILTGPPNMKVASASALVSSVITQEFGMGVMQALSNLDDMVYNIVPPLGMIMRTLGKITFNIVKVINAVLSPISLATLIPVSVLMAPFMYLGNITTRKGEVYADSFAASYGYSAEIVSSLEKLNVYLNQDTNDTFLNVFYDLAMLQADIINVCCGGHGSTQQRALRMVDKFDKDLEASSLSNADKATIRAEKERLIKTYDKLMQADTGTKSSMTRAFRKMIDNWYAGKNYMFVPIMDRELQYAE